MLLRTECRVEMMLVSLLSNDIFKSTCYLLLVIFITKNVVLSYSYVQKNNVREK